MATMRRYHYIKLSDVNTDSIYHLGDGKTTLSQVTPAAHPYDKLTVYDLSESYSFYLRSNCSRRMCSDFYAQPIYAMHKQYYGWKSTQAVNTPSAQSNFGVLGALNKSVPDSWYWIQWQTYKSLKPNECNEIKSLWCGGIQIKGTTYQATRIKMKAFEIWGALTSP